MKNNQHSVPYSNRFAWLTSAADHFAITLLEYVLRAGIRPAVIICDESAGEYVEQLSRLSEEHHLALVTVPPTPRDPMESKKDWRERYDRQLAGEIKRYDVALLLLVGYMRIVSEILINQWPMTLNLHPAAPLGPIGTWRDVVWCYISVQARVVGASIHLVTLSLDRGPVVAFTETNIDTSTFEPMWKNFLARHESTNVLQLQSSSVESDPLFCAIRAAQFELEPPLLVATLRGLESGSIDLNQHLQQDPFDGTLTVRMDQEVLQLLSQLTVRAL